MLQAGLSATPKFRPRIQRQGTTVFPEATPATPARQATPARPARTQAFHRRPAFDTDRSDLVDFLREDLDHLFDDQGIDVSAYEDRVTFRDPITSYSTIQGYVANIKFLRTIFRPKFTLHDIKQTGEDEITYVSTSRCFQRVFLCTRHTLTHLFARLRAPASGGPWTWL